MRFRVLGPVEARSDGGSLVGLPAKQRSLLAVLSLHAGRMVSMDRLVAAIWPDLPPRSAVRVVRTYVSVLRQSLGLPRQGLLPCLAAVGSGYQLEVARDDLDMLVFDALAGQGRQALNAGDASAASWLLDQALGLWRGDPAQDATVDDDTGLVLAGLAERRLQAEEDRAEAGLHLGEDGDLIPRLRRLVTGHPLRERPWGQLMTALCLAGQNAAALAAYRQLRAYLAQELGVEPDPRLQELHQKILANELPPAAQSSPLTIKAPRAPRQLPPDVSHFTGRTAEMELLDGLLGSRTADLASLSGHAARSDRGQDAVPPAIVITGGAGVGKTALAVRWAHLMAEAFPDGQLYVDLRGYSGAVPVTALDALTALLHGLAVPPARVPAHEGQAAALYRSEMAHRRMIVVLDNAYSSVQVRPLLSGHSGSVTLVTSRAGLTGLTAKEGAVRVTLNPLTGAEALTLLSAIVGADRVRREAGAAAELARLCANLPLALRIAAARLQALPHAQVSDYASDIAGEDGFASLQVDGDEAASVWTAFELSYLALDPPARRVFRLLGMMASADLPVQAIAAMNGAAVSSIRRTLDQLADAHLVEQHSGARFGAHDLLRRYAWLKSKTEDTAADRQAAVQRLLQWYLTGSDQAIRLFSPSALRRLPLVSGEGTGPAFAGRDEALAWLDNERAHMAAAIVRAADEQDSATLLLVTQLAQRLHTYLFRRGHLSSDIAVSKAALKAAMTARDAVAEAGACIAIGLTSVLQGQNSQALTWLYRALKIARTTGDPYLLANCLSNVADVQARLGDPGECEAALTEEMALRIAIADIYGEALCLLNLGEFCCREGRYDQSRTYYQDGLSKMRAVGDRYGEALALHGLGLVETQQEHFARASGSINEAVTILREIANRSALAYMLADLGHTYQRLRQSGQALNCLHEGLRLCRELGMRRREADYLQELSDALDEIHPQQADSYRQQARTILGELQ